MKLYEIFFKLKNLRIHLVKTYKTMFSCTEQLTQFWYWIPNWIFISMHLKWHSQNFHKLLNNEIFSSMYMCVCVYIYTHTHAHTHTHTHRYIFHYIYIYIYLYKIIYIYIYIRNCKLIFNKWYNDKFTEFYVAGPKYACIIITDVCQSLR